MPIHVAGPSAIRAKGNKIKIIEEFIGRVNTNTGSISIARMKSPSGWSEPGQRPEFDEYTVVIAGMLRVEAEGLIIDVHAGQAVIVKAGEHVKYSTPSREGAEYIAVCVPAFSADTVHRDGDV